MNGGFTPNRWPYIGVPYPSDLGGLGSNQSSASAFCHLSSLGNIGSQDMVGLENGGLVTMNMPSMSPISQSALNGNYSSLLHHLHNSIFQLLLL